MIVEVLDRCAPSGRSSARLVCRLWNSLIVDKAAFWNCIRVGPRCDKPEIVDLHLTRSKDLPLTFTFERRDSHIGMQESSSKKMLKSLMRHAGRWEDVSFILVGHKVDCVGAQLSSFISTDVKLRLKRLYLYHDGHWKTDDLGEFWKLLVSSAVLEGARWVQGTLATGRLDHVVDAARRVNLEGQWHKLTSVDLQIAHVEPFLDSLRAFCSLEECTIHELLHSRTPSAVPVFEVRAKNLRSLRISGGEFGKMVLLDRLTVPSLVDFRMSCDGVSFDCLSSFVQRSAPPLTTVALTIKDRSLGPLPRFLAMLATYASTLTEFSLDIRPFPGATSDFAMVQLPPLAISLPDVWRCVLVIFADTGRPLSYILDSLHLPSLRELDVGSPVEAVTSLRLLLERSGARVKRLRANFECATPLSRFQLLTSQWLDKLEHMEVLCFTAQMILHFISRKPCLLPALKRVSIYVSTFVEPGDLEAVQSKRSILSGTDVDIKVFEYPFPLVF
ncbi:hypothetical protein VNI00_004403 [Paramarasmius palmivorus]|uniref:F-box domain-containing protein n=1 Tax=Paramarasmius palmivorus TaxID=297713 RepID=A0AAW0DRI7_9AGAR